MRFGIVSPATPVLPAHCEAAEALGFESPWLFDSHMIYTDFSFVLGGNAHELMRHFSQAVIAHW
jgi:alkanesulfonate monooxygenase SsuD/methylene tetrahydromethanopterin reductase-like flavin-dependent oxidoreductase (luciferase family)